MKSTKSWHFAISILVIFAATTAIAQGNGKLEGVKTAVQNQNFAKALADARTIIKADPKNFQALYYAGMAALGLNQFDVATNYAQNALEIAPENSKPTVQSLLDLIASTKEGFSAANDAENALSAGEFGKAASLYEKAYWAKPTDSGLGLKAAAIYQKQLGSPLRAAKIYRNIIAKAPKSADADVARNGLGEIDAALKKISLEKLNAAIGAAQNNASESDVNKLFSEAEIANPNQDRLFDYWINSVAKYNDGEMVLTLLKKKQGTGPLEPKFIAKIPNISGFIEEENFATSLKNMIGDENFDVVMQSNHMAKLKRFSKEKLILYKSYLKESWGKNRDPYISRVALGPPDSYYNRRYCLEMVTDGYFLMAFGYVNDGTDKISDWKINDNNVDTAPTISKYYYDEKGWKKNGCLSYQDITAEITQ